MVRIICRAGILLCGAAIIAGCAATMPQTAASAVEQGQRPGSRGTLYLALAGELPAQSGKSASPRYLPRRVPESRESVWKRTASLPSGTLITLTDDTGRAIGKLPADLDPGEVVLETFSREMTAKGFTVNLVEKLPANDGIGIEIAVVAAQLRASSGLLTVEGTCALTVGLDLWRHGSRLASREYTAAASEWRFASLQELAYELVTLSSQQVVDQAMPAILEGLVLRH